MKSTISEVNAIGIAKRNNPPLLMLILLHFRNETRMVVYMNTHLILAALKFQCCSDYMI